MKALVRISAVAMAAFLAACSTTDQRQYEACIAGSSAAGGVLATVTTGAGGLAGAAAGAGVGAVICEEADAPEPVRYEAAPVDSDGDGVTDDVDRCPNTPAGAAVDVNGCALDSDGDSVKDYQDDCPNTPAGVVVDSRGCPIKNEIVLTINHVEFAFDSAELDAESRSALDAAVAVIKSHDSVSMDLIGHTDSKGSDAYNQKLSERRARAAVAYLVSKGVRADQLTAVGRGESSPVASNDTDAGRARNRRVELVVR